MKNNIDDLRDHLFETLEALRDTDDPMDIKRAKTIADVAQTVINTAKIELEFAELTGAAISGFIDKTQRKALPSPNERKPRLVGGDE